MKLYFLIVLNSFLFFVSVLDFTHHHFPRDTPFVGSSPSPFKRVTIIPLKTKMPIARLEKLKIGCYRIITFTLRFCEKKGASFFRISVYCPHLIGTQMNPVGYKLSFGVTPLDINLENRSVLQSCGILFF